MIHEQPTPIEKAPATTTTSKISGLISILFARARFLRRRPNEAGCPHNCCYCIYTVVEGKQVRINPGSEVVAEMQQLYNQGIRNFWFTDAQFIPARKFINDAVELLQLILDAGMKDIHWAAYIRADNLTQLCDLMVKTGMNYFEIGITSGSQELAKMRMGYNLRTVLSNCRDLNWLQRPRFCQLLI